jgi:alpha-tubulin suppressor-like RCC1 family protein
MATLINDSFKKATLPLTLGVSGTIGTASNTIDIASAFNITASIGGLTLSLPTPTDTTGTDVVEISNVGTNSFIMYNVTLLANQFLTVVWNGTVWQENKTSGATITTEWFNTVTSLAPATTDTVTLSQNFPQNPEYGGMWLHNGVMYSYGDSGVKGIGNDESAEGGGSLMSPVPAAIDYYNFAGTLVGYTPYFTKFWNNRYVAFALDQNQKLWFKGWNNTGASGISAAGTGVVFEQWTLVTGPLNALNIVDLAIGDGDTGNTDYNSSILAITDTGTVWSWGANSWGQLGHGNTTTPRQTPQQVTLPIGTIASKVYVSGNESGQGVHCAILDNDGKFFVSGYNGNGQLGLGNTTQQTLFTLSTTGVLDAYLVAQDSYIITTTGSISATGANGNGCHGRGVTSATTSWLNATSFIGVASKIVASKHGGAAGESIYIIDSTKNLWVGGYNNYGQLGLGASNVTQQNIHVLLTIAQLPIQGQVKEVFPTANGQPTAYVLGDNGHLYTAGSNLYGNRGIGSKPDNNNFRPVWLRALIPTSVVTMRPAAEDTTGTFMALDVNGDLWTAGYRSQIPNGNTAAVDLSSPVKVLWGRNTGTAIAPSTGAVTVVNNADGTTTVDSSLGGTGIVAQPINALTTLVGAIDSTADYLAIYDASTSSYKKILLGQLAFPKLITQNLVSGNNVIVHNFNRVTPFAVMVEVRNAAGALVAHTRTTMTANNVTINVGVAVANAQIILI